MLVFTGGKVRTRHSHTTTYHYTLSHTQTQTHLEVKELAVASENEFGTAIAPGHFDDVNLQKQTKTNVFKLTNKHYGQPLDDSNPRGHHS